jgi:outer membrane lipoprotein SlyB
LNLKYAFSVCSVHCFYIGTRINKVSFQENTVKNVLASCALSAALIGSAQANGYPYGSQSYSRSYSSNEYSASAPRQECWQEPVRTVEQPGFLRNNIGLLLGGSAGALLGGQIGHGSGRKAATIGGGLLGAWGGYEYARRYHPAQGRESVSYETRCR